MQAVSELMARALDLWHGPALADVRQGRVLEAEAASLEEHRGWRARTAHPGRPRAAPGTLNILGRTDDAGPQASDERELLGLLMVALYLVGHVARALDAFQRLRTVLGDELGIDLSPWICLLHQSILSGDPAQGMALLPRPGPGWCSWMSPWYPAERYYVVLPTAIGGESHSTNIRC